MKSCTKCKEKKELSLFPNSKTTKDKKGSHCKQCVSNNTQKYISKNKESHKKKMDEWRNNNPSYMTEWNQKNKGYHGEYYHNKTKHDELKKLKHSIRGLIYDSFKRGANHKFQKDTTTEALLGCSMEFFIQHLQSQFTEGMTLMNHGEWHIDHIIPISSAKTKEEVYLLCHYTNLQPLWARDNLVKKNKLII
jgi:hypothetical protein